MPDQIWKSRTKLLAGDDGLIKLKNTHVLVAGLGGVGAAAAEMLCRAGIGEMSIIDGDVVNPSNRNRQIPALVSTNGKPKAQVMAARLLDINPDLKLNIIEEYIKDERLVEILEKKYDFVLDAIDTLSPKVYLIFNAVKNNHNLISSMGAGGKFDPSLVKIADISESHQCKLAYYIRKRLHKLGIFSGFKVVFSTEYVPRERVILSSGEMNKKSTVGTISYMPPIFGCFMASEVIRQVLNK